MIGRSPRDQIYYICMCAHLKVHTHCLLPSAWPPAHGMTCAVCNVLCLSVRCAICHVWHPTHEVCRVPCAVCRALCVAVQRWPRWSQACCSQAASKQELQPGLHRFR